MYVELVGKVRLALVWWSKYQILPLQVGKMNKWNFILGLEDEYGEWIEEENQIGDLLVRYYSNHFTSSNPTQLDPVLNGVELRVSEEMNK